MEKLKVDKYKKLLFEAKAKIINGGTFCSDKDLSVSSDDLSDDADLASSVINQSVTFNMRQRELNKLNAIEEALYRIEQGTFGICEECDESIGDSRLKNQPWTKLCITDAEELERVNHKFNNQISENEIL